MNIEQLMAQYQSASISRAAIEKAAFEAPERSLVESLLEAREAERASLEALQKALWRELHALDEAA